MLAKHAMKKVMMVGIDSVRGNRNILISRKEAFERMYSFCFPLTRREKLQTSDFSSRDCGSLTQSVWISSGQMVAEY